MRRIENNEIVSTLEDRPKYNLGEVSSVNPGFRELLSEEVIERLKNITLGYGDLFGSPRLRDSISQQIEIPPENILITVGGTLALFMVTFILCEPGDEAVVTTPSWPPTFDGMRAVGAEIKEVRLTFEGGYRFDPEAFRAQLSPETTLVSIATPQNPSGVSFSDDDCRRLLDSMAQVCPQAYLMVDEIYRLATYGDSPIPPSVAGMSDRILTTSSISKAQSIPGFRIGWLTCNSSDLLQQLATLQLNMISTHSVVCEELALEVLRRSDEILRKTREKLKIGVETVSDWIRKEQAFLEWVRPNGGALCCVRLRPDVFDDNAVQRFYKRARAHEVLVAKGNWFREEARVFRLGFAFQPLSMLKEALDEMSKALRETLDRK